MSYLEEARDIPETQLTGVWSGMIAENVSDLNEKVFVTVPDLSADYRLGPCRWQARDETSLPARGDRCTIVFDQDQEPVVVMWWPFPS